MSNRIQQALISVHDKTGLADFARRLSALGIRILSTGGTARLLGESSIAARDVSEVTGFPEMLGGRVKTLHPRVHGAILADRHNTEHMKTLQSMSMEPIDLVVVNLYPFERVAEDREASIEDLVENIDIGGVTLIRAAAKNFHDVAVIVSPRQYEEVVKELEAHGAALTLSTRLRLAQQAFEVVTQYDAAIQQELGDWTLPDAKSGVARHSSEFPPSTVVSLKKVRGLRYGENPHQGAAVYRDARISGPRLATSDPLQGKELSYNNLLDLDAAWRLSREFEKPTAVLIKHNNPCGVASASDAVAAYRLALACDPVSAYGSVMAFNVPIDQKLAEEIAKLFVEAIVAPAYAPEAREIFSKKKNLRLLERPSRGGRQEFANEVMDLRQIDGGFLAQSRNDLLLEEAKLKVVSRREPTAAEWESLRFAWRVVKHTKSNAIVFTKGEQALGVGAGQMSRVDSVKIAVMKAQQSLQGSVVASDAFFPFRDGVDAAVQAGAVAFIQPGGSVRDEEVIQAANEANAAMVFTGIRHFRH